jgi:acyl dehydratase
MAFKADELVKYPIPQGEQTLHKKDCMLYALAVGLGGDPTDQQQLRFVYEHDLQALPTMSNVLAHPGFWMKAADTGVDWQRVLHGEQKFTIHKRLPVEGILVSRSRIKAIIDKGEERGAFVYLERSVTDKATGEAVCTLEQTTVCRGDGGCGDFGEVNRERHAIPDRDPDHVCDFETLPQAALLYRLNGDYNPLHADPEGARSAGYDRPILHGLCTFGIAGHAVLRCCCHYDPERVRSMSVRFTAPVFPGETIRTEMWLEGDNASFRSRVVERDTIVLGAGWAELTG